MAKGRMRDWKILFCGKIIIFYPSYLSKYSPSRVFPSKNTPDSRIVKIKNFIFF
jgi:hypothetical protein